jgi:hypothetical protein
MEHLKADARPQRWFSIKLQIVDVAADNPSLNPGLSQRKLTSDRAVYLVTGASMNLAFSSGWIMPLLRTSPLKAEPAGTLHSLDDRGTMDEVSSHVRLDLPFV